MAGYGSFLGSGFASLGDKIGENVSSGNLPVYPDTPLAPLIAADRAVAIVTLPNGANPAG